MSTSPHRVQVAVTAYVDISDEEPLPTEFVDARSPLRFLPDLLIVHWTKHARPGRFDQWDELVKVTGAALNRDGTVRLSRSKTVVRASRVYRPNDLGVAPAWLVAAVQQARHAMEAQT